jgi:internalin A
MTAQELFKVIKQAGQSRQISLDLSNNNLRELPREIGDLTMLQDLNLADNELSELPRETAGLSHLKELVLSRNNLKALPPELGALIWLRALRLEGNPLIFPPPEIVSQGTAAVLVFLRAQVSTVLRRRVWLSKLLLVGEGGVGKTCLLKRLRGEDFVPGLGTTHGIEVDFLSLLHPREPNVTMTLNSWDFGGQEVYHATHQFFLTNRSLFLLLWNARLGYEQGKLYYWLDAIKSRAPDSPVMLVATHIDERDADLPLADLRQSYPQVQGIWRVSNKTADGVPELRTGMARVAADPRLMPLMGESWPKNWFEAAEAIRELHDNYTTPQKVTSLLESHGVRDQSACTLRRWLHELGDILDFPDDEELRDMVILKPQWVTRHISDVLESEEVIDGLGLFPRTLMERIWKDFDSGLQQHLLRLMEKFDLSYRTQDNEEISIVVERLSLDEHRGYHKPWDDIGHEWPNREIRMIFKMEGTVPAGVPTWFFARAHRFTTHTHWRFGALFTDRKEPPHLALVQAFPTQRQIQLAVRGPAPHNFFTLLRDGLELTLARFPGLPVKRLIPCPGHRGMHCSHLFQFEQLEKRLALDPPKFFIECPEANEDVAVQQLLFGLTPGTQDDVVRKLDALLTLEQKHHVEQIAEMKALGELHERQFFLKTVRLQQSMLEAPCPSVFTLRPDNSPELFRRVAGAHLILQLYCEEPGCWHPVHEGGQYHIEQPAAWLKAIGPHLRTLVKVLKYVAPLPAPLLGEFAKDYEELLKPDLELMKALVDKLPTLEETKQSKPLPAAGRHADLFRTDGSELRAVAELLMKIDPNKRWGGLRPTLTPEGHCLWLCRQHAAPYTR